MPFISKEERQKRISKLQSTDVGKRFFVLVSLIIAVAFIIFVLIMQLLPMFPAFQEFTQNYTDGEWINWGEDGQTFSGLTPYGLGMTIATCAVIAMLVASFIMFLTMRSLKWGFKETIDLMSQPIPGESGKFATRGKMKRILGKRLATERLKKGKK